MQIYHKHKYAQNMDKYVKPNMRKYVIYMLKNALYVKICIG